MFVVSFKNVTIFGSTGTSNITGQIMLYETTNNIEIHVNNVVQGTTRALTLGIENATGTSGVSPAGRNNTAFVVSTPEAWRFSPGNFTYAWSPATNLSSTTIANPVASNLTSTATYTVTVTETTSGCSATASQTINVFGLPTISPAADTLCTGEGTTLTASSGTSYAWASGETTQAITIFPTSTTTYTVTVTGATGCTGTASATVTVNPLPTAAITPMMETICVGQSTTLTASGGTSYSWTTGETTSSITVSPAFISGYAVTVTDANGCTATADALIFTNDPPATPTITAGATSFCEGDSTTLDAGSGYTTYMWSNGSMMQTTTALTDGIYTVTVTGSDNDCTATASIAITVNAAPTPTIMGDDVICAGETTTLDAGGGMGGASIIHTVQVANFSFTPSNVNVSVGDVVHFVWTVGNHSTTSDATTGPMAWNSGVQPTGSNYDVIVTQAGVHPYYCIPHGGPGGMGMSGTITASSASGTYTDYLWSTGATTQTISGSPAATTTYTVTVTDGNGCTGTDAITITVNALPTPSISGNTGFCFGDSTTLDAGAGYMMYMWSDGSMMQTLTVTQSGTYTVTVMDDNGCTGTASVTVTESPLPTPTISGEMEFCLGSTTTLDAGDDYDMYMWSNGLMTQTIEVKQPGGLYRHCHRLNWLHGYGQHRRQLVATTYGYGFQQRPHLRRRYGYAHVFGWNFLRLARPNRYLELAEHHLGKYQYQQGRYLYRHRDRCQWLYRYGGYPFRN